MLGVETTTQHIKDIHQFTVDSYHFTEVASETNESTIVNIG
jgi:hypothetical protein